MYNTEIPMSASGTKVTHSMIIKSPYSAVNICPASQGIPSPW